MRGDPILDPRHSQLNKLAKEIQGLKDCLVKTDLYLRRVELHEFVLWSGTMHYDVQGVRASVESLARALTLIDRQNKASWCATEGGFPKKFSMGALLLMHDMILGRLFGSAGNANEEVRRHSRLAPGRNQVGAPRPGSHPYSFHS